MLSVVWNIPNCPDSILFSLSQLFFFAFIIPWNTQEKTSLLCCNSKQYCEKSYENAMNLKVSTINKSIFIVVQCFWDSFCHFFCHLSQTQKIKITNKYTISRQEELTCEWRKHNFENVFFSTLILLREFWEREMREFRERKVQ